MLIAELIYVKELRKIRFIVIYSDPFWFAVGRVPNRLCGTDKAERIANRPGTFSNVSKRLQGVQS